MWICVDVWMCRCGDVGKCEFTVCVCVCLCVCVCNANGWLMLVLVHRERKDMNMAKNRVDM